MATVTVRPVADGSVITYSRVGDDANWKCVDDVTPDDAATFVNINDGDTAGDLYVVGSSGLSAGDTINSVTIHARAVAFGADSFQWQAAAGSGAEVYGGAVSVSDVAYTNYDSGALTVIPNTGDPWTLAALDALEIGTVASNIEVRIRLTQIYAVIDYDPPAATPRSWGQIIG